MPAGQGNDRESNGSEIFAAAVDRGTHPAFAGDVELARDLELVALLQASGPELAPRPDERARARAAMFARLTAAQDPSDHVDVPGAGPVDRPQPDRGRPGATALLEVTEVVTEPEPVADGAGSEVDELAVLRRGRRSRHAMPARRRSADDAARRPPLGGRIVLVAAAAVLGSAVLGGTGILASRNALPGDGLYQVKRVAESAGLAMTFDDTERARRHLELASTRVDEVEQLLAAEGAGMDPEVFSSGLQDFDSEAEQGHRLLLTAQEQSRAQAEAEWQAWAAGQAARIATLRGDLPGPAATHADGSLERLEQLAGPGAPDGSGACDATTGAGCTGATAESGIPTTGADTTGTVDPTQTDRTPSTGRSGSGGGASDAGQQDDGPAELLPGPLPKTPLDGVLDGSGEQGPSRSGSSGSDDGGSDDDGGDSGSIGSGAGLPPVEVPPLVPGLSGVSIGG
jgi:hypothetical protein